jgi:hypothetical protein
MGSYKGHKSAWQNANTKQQEKIKTKPGQKSTTARIENQDSNLNSENNRTGSVSTRITCRGF